MCGIAGFWGDNRSHHSESTLRCMTDAVCHRGPDAEGLWMDSASGIAMGHRRLAIVDLSPLGAQPMHSASGRFVTVFNGEIYNYRDLRRELHDKGISFRGHSDTEVLLAAIEEWGLIKALQRSVGMFALAVFDRERRELHLARDRAGEKPLYYGNCGNTLVFGSELKALRQHPDFTPQIDRDSLAVFLRRGYVPAPYSIYDGIGKVSPGTVLTFREGARNTRSKVEQAYWTAETAVRDGLATGPVSTAALAEEFEFILRRSVAEQMVADVPVGAFLSGGVDSSLVVAMMQAQSAQAVRTFTIGFRETGYDEALYARRVAAHLGTDHTELYVTPEDAMRVIPTLPAMYDEPFADSSQIPTALVSALARKSVTVSLTGDGADELFGGYSRYFTGTRIWKRLQPIPLPLRRGLARAIRGVSSQNWSALLSVLGPLTPRALAHGGGGDRLHRLAGVFALESPETLYDHLLSRWRTTDGVVIGGNPRSRLRTNDFNREETGSLAQWMMYSDFLAYLPDDILVKVDRASMAVSLESRAPFLDHRMIEFSWRAPIASKISNGIGKQLMRTLLYRHVPRELVDRPKKGFGVPVHEWLRGPLRDWAESLLDTQRLQAEGFFNAGPIRQTWDEHLSGKSNWQTRLWPVLMFQAWHQEQQSRARPSLTHTEPLCSGQ